jgi:LysM repeat protein
VLRDSTRAAAPIDVGQLPTSHTVARGETLWSIAQLYFGDPLLWPEIYRLNTAVVEDPHWIYPGEVLTLGAPGAIAQGQVDTTAVTVPQGAAADTVKAAPTDTVAAADTVAIAAPDTTQAAPAEPPPPPPPPPTESYQTIFDRAVTRTQEVQDILRLYANQPYRPLRRGEYYSAGWLTEGEKLPWAEVLGNTATPAITRLSDRTNALQYEEIAIRPPSGVSYHVGDSLLVARLDRDEPDWGGVVVPLGVARVTEVQDKQVLAQVILQFGRIHDRHLALPLEPFKDPGEVRPAPVAQGLQGKLIVSRDLHPLAATQQIYFLDKGRADGVALGDVFEAYRPATGEPGSPSEEVRLQLMVVHTRDHSSSALVIGIANPDVGPGMPVRLVKKMPT